MRTFLSVLFFLTLPLSSALANSMLGTEFWFGFMENQTSPEMKVVVTSNTTTNGTLSVPLAGWTQNFTIPANSSIEIVIPYGIVEAVGNMSIESKGVHLISNDPVYVSILNGTGGSKDASSILPIDALGYEYLALSYIDPPNTNWGTPEILIVALEDDTQVEIDLSGALSNGQNGTISVTLNQGQTYQVQSHWMNGGQHGGDDLSGSFIRSVCNSDGFKHRIAVFSGDLCSVIGGLGCTGCDHLVEQMWPTEHLGTNFTITAPVNRNSYIFKIAARENGTVVNVAGLAPINMNAGDWYQVSLSGDKTITSNQPIAVGQFTRGQGCSVGLGDPFFAQIIPNSQMIYEWEFFSYASGSSINPFDSYVNIVTPSLGPPVFLDGTVIPASSFQNVGANRVAKIPIPSNSTTHKLTCGGGFAAYMYGFGAANSYSYNSGIFSNSSNSDFDISYLMNTANYALFEDTVCSCEPVTFISNFTSPGHTISWDFGDGQTATGTSVTHDYLNGTYDVTMIIEDNSGCKIDSIVKLDLVVINCDISGPLEPICSGESITLSSINTAVNYLWSTGETTQSITVNPTQTTTYSLQLDGGSIPICDSLIVEVHVPVDQPLSDTLICENGNAEFNLGSNFSNFNWSNGATTPSITVNQAGTYYVQALDSNECIFMDTAVLSVQGLPIWTIIGPDLFCEGDSVLLIGPSIANANYYWSTTQVGQNITVSNSALYQLTIDDGICISTDALEVQEIESMANFGSLDTTICADYHTLEVPNIVGTDYSWSTGSTTHTTEVTNSDTYWITLSNQCETWTDTMEVIFDCSWILYAPNAFTPDGDGVNDVFRAEGHGFKEFELLIFNRWGQIVFRSTDINDGWDGVYRGEQSQVGVYTYKIRTVSITNTDKEYTGHVSLIR